MAPSKDIGPDRASFRTSDRRGRSLHARQKRRLAEDALLDAVLLPHEDAVIEPVGIPSQTLLMRGLARVARQPGVGGAVAWSLAGDGQPRVLAAQPARFATMLPPIAEHWEAIAPLSDAYRLTDGDLPEDFVPMLERGVSAVMPIPGLGSMPSACLIVFSQNAGRPLRPRTMAVLREVATRLADSLATQLALERLGQLDDAVKRLDRQAALGDLVAEIVHEIRNPLVSVKTFLQLLPERLDDPDFHGEFRELVESEVQRLERLLSDLLRQSRPSARTENGEGAQVEEAIETTLQLFGYRCRERGIELDMKVASNLPRVALAEDALRQLLLNLLLNATEVTDAGGHIGLSIDWSRDLVNHLEICVEDEGPGIDPAIGAKIFEPFWTTRAEGVGGLGLAICKRIVEEAQGTIEVVRSRRGGACFRVDLPISS